MTCTHNHTRILSASLCSVLKLKSRVQHLVNAAPLQPTQAASKLKPNIITRYQIFTFFTKAKHLRNAKDGALDLQSYVEFKSNYRSLARVHKKALKAQRDFWKLFMHTSAHVGTVRLRLHALEDVAERAQVCVCVSLRVCMCMCACGTVRSWLHALEDVAERAQVFCVCVHVYMCACVYV